MLERLLDRIFSGQMAVLNKLSTNDPPSNRHDPIVPLHPSSPTPNIHPPQLLIPAIKSLIPKILDQNIIHTLLLIHLSTNGMESKNIARYTSLIQVLCRAYACRSPNPRSPPFFPPLERASTSPLASPFSFEPCKLIPIRQPLNRARRPFWFLRPKCKWEMVFFWIFFFPTISQLASTIHPQYININVRKFPRNIILGTQSLASLLQRSKITWCHHSGAIAGRAGGG